MDTNTATLADETPEEPIGKMVAFISWISGFVLGGLIAGIVTGITAIFVLIN